MDTLTITELRRAAMEGRIEAKIHAQIETLTHKETSQQKPFWELNLADAEAKLKLRAWSDSPNYKQCAELDTGGFLEISGDFSHNPNFGIESKRWTCRALDDEERAALLGGPRELRERQARDFGFISKTAAALAEPRLQALCGLFLEQHGERFRRTAAARGNHHARRGGLVEHVAQMMRAANALSDVYPQLNRELLLAGVLFHDCGKLWENPVAETGFNMPFVEAGELLGHITIGIELVNLLWRKLDLEQWSELRPASEDVRLHLLHLIAAHHGELQFGSPVPPKTPEAQALHYIDNLDAKMEMFALAYARPATLGPRIFERLWPLPGNEIAPLQKLGASADSARSQPAAGI